MKIFEKNILYMFALFLWIFLKEIYFQNVMKCACRQRAISGRIYLE